MSFDLKNLALEVWKPRRRQKARGDRRTPCQKKEKKCLYVINKINN